MSTAEAMRAAGIPDLFTNPVRRPGGFGGDTYEPEHDHARLAGQLQRVEKLMQDGRWRTLTIIATLAGCSEASASARLRDLRKERFGRYLIERRRAAGLPKSSGLFEYRLAGRRPD